MPDLRPFPDLDPVIHGRQRMDEEFLPLFDRHGLLLSAVILH
jgi:hypothetical protein